MSVGSLQVHAQRLLLGKKQILAAVSQLPVELPPPTWRRIPSFRKLHRLQPANFRRGQASCWQSEFPEDLLELFYREQGETLRELGYLSEAPSASALA